MSVLIRPTSPEWLATEMPPGYQTRVLEIERLSRELRDMERFGRLLWGTGRDLDESVTDVLGALRLQAEPLPALGASSLAVRLEDRRRLLVHISSSQGVIQKKHESLARVFQILHEVAEDTDRVVLIGNSEPEKRPAERSDPLAPDALDLLVRLGANFVSTSTLFALWLIALQEPKAVDSYFERLHAQAGGVFQLPAAAMR